MTAEAKRFELQALREPCACGRAHDLAVRRIVLRRGALDALPEVLRELGVFRKPTAVYDGHTYDAAGRRVRAALPACGSLVLPAAGLHADEHAVTLLEERLPADTDLLLAVGSGTLHDIVRYVAHGRGIPFLSVPTAASVDGFVSTVAAMTWRGVKVSSIASSPAAVVADSAVFAAAPRRLTASGAGDLLGKHTALADWVIANELTGEPLCGRVLMMEQKAVREAEERLDELYAGDEAACERLMYALLLSGLAMQMVDSSRPASGAEHHVSHLWEMGLLNPPLGAYHGEMVGAASTLVADAYHGRVRAFCAGPLRSFTGPDEADLSRFGSMADEIRRVNKPEPLAGVSPENVAFRAGRIISAVDAVPSSRALRDKLSRVGAPVTPADIGLPAGIEALSLGMAPYIRNRLTLLRALKMLEAY